MAIRQNYLGQNVFERFDKGFRIRIKLGGIAGLQSKVKVLLQSRKRQPVRRVALQQTQKESQ